MPTDKNILFSVIIPSYNRAAFLPVAIKSLLYQSYSNWELIIVDDGSSDNTKEVVNSFGDPRIIYHYQDNQERSRARNNGIKIAKGDYICFVDSDDFYKENHLQVLYDHILAAKQAVAFFYTGAVARIDNIWYMGKSPSPNKEPIRSAIEDFFYPTSACFHKDILKKHAFPPDYYMCEDTHLFIRVLCDFPYVPIYQATTVKIEHPETSTNGRFYSVPKMLNTMECLHDLSSNYLANNAEVKTQVDQLNLNTFTTSIAKLFFGLKWGLMWKMLRSLFSVKHIRKALWRQIFRYPFMVIKIFAREALSYLKVYNNKGLACLKDEEVPSFP